MYRCRVERLNLNTLVSKLRGESTSPCMSCAPVIYPNSDINSARKILNKLLDRACQNEVVSIKEVLPQIKEF